MPSNAEINDSFEICHSYNLINLLNEIIDNYNNHAIPILNKDRVNKSEFVNLIKNNINYKTFYNNLNK